MAHINLQKAPAYTHQEYPRIVYDPITAESRTVASEADVPFGWVRFHPKDPDKPSELAVPSHAQGQGGHSAAAGAKAPPPFESRQQAPEGSAKGVLPADRREDRTWIIQQLRERRIKFNSRATTNALAVLLEG